MRIEKIGKRRFGVVEGTFVWGYVGGLAGMRVYPEINWGAYSSFQFWDSFARYTVAMSWACYRVIEVASATRPNTPRSPPTSAMDWTYATYRDAFK